MARKPVRFASTAADDLRKIQHYTVKQWGREQWRYYSDALDALFNRVGNNPELGPARDEVRAGLRSLPMGSHVVWYRPRADHVQVVRILHAVTDSATRL